jgi:hypothetical protein
MFVLIEHFPLYHDHHHPRHHLSIKRTNHPSEIKVKESIE